MIKRKHAGVISVLLSVIIMLTIMLAANVAANASEGDESKAQIENVEMYKSNIHHEIKEGS